MFDTMSILIFRYAAISTEYSLFIRLNLRRILWYITTHRVPINWLPIFNLVLFADCLRYISQTKTA
jgi:hypothetical protein